MSKAQRSAEPMHAVLEELYQLRKVAVAARACVQWQKDHDTYKCMHEVPNDECRACFDEPPHFPVGVDEFAALHGALIDAGLMPRLFSEEDPVKVFDEWWARARANDPPGRDIVAEIEECRRDD
jgi:hypothetical protein